MITTFKTHLVSELYTTLITPIPSISSFNMDSQSISLDNMDYSHSGCLVDAAASYLQDLDLASSFKPIITPLVEKAAMDNKSSTASQESAPSTPSRGLILTPSKSTLFRHLDPAKCNKDAYFAHNSDGPSIIAAQDNYNGSSMRVPNHLDFSEELSFHTASQESAPCTPSRGLILTPSKSTLFEHLDPARCSKAKYFADNSDGLSIIADQENCNGSNMQVSDYSLTMHQQEDDESIDANKTYEIGTQLCTLNASTKDKRLNKLRWKRLIASTKLKKSSFAKIRSTVKCCLPDRHTCHKKGAVTECKQCAKDNQ